MCSCSVIASDGGEEQHDEIGTVVGTVVEAAIFVPERTYHKRTECENRTKSTKEIPELTHTHQVSGNMTHTWIDSSAVQGSVFAGAADTQPSPEENFLFLSPLSL